MCHTAKNILRGGLDSAGNGQRWLSLSGGSRGTRYFGATFQHVDLCAWTIQKKYELIEDIPTKKDFVGIVNADN